MKLFGGRRLLLPLVLFSFLLPPSTLLLTSCGTGDDDGSRLGEVIVGTWQRTELTFEGDTELDPEDFTYDLFIYNGDGSYNGMVRQGTFSLISKYGSLIYEGNYKCDNDNIRLEFDDDGTQRKILAQVIMFTETTLQLKYVVEEYNVTIHLTLTKL